MSDQLMDRIFEVRRNPAATYEDVRGLLGFALDQFQAHFGPPANWRRPVYGPLAGLVDGVRNHPEWHAWARRRSIIMLGFMVWFVKYVLGVKKRPGYNDFLIMRWALLGDEETARTLLNQTKREDSVGCTACWALRSLCQQYPEFQERFGGLIPKANPEDMLKDAPASSDPADVLRRAQWIDKTRLGAE